MNRSNQAANITSNVYQNTTHNITGTILQSVMLNQNNSYVNIVSDTSLLDVRNFSPYTSYTPGMGCFYADTLFKDSINHYGSWVRNHFIKITRNTNAYDTILKAGSNITLTRGSGKVITIAASGGGGSVSIPSNSTLTLASSTDSINGRSNLTANLTCTSSRTSWTAVYQNISDGETVDINYYKTNDTNCVITFPTATIVSQSCNGIVSGHTLTLRMKVMYTLYFAPNP